MKSNEIDLTIPNRQFRVSTTVVRDGIGYMGPSVKINAHDAADAVRRVERAGHKANPHFPPEEMKRNRWAEEWKKREMEG